jgi:hypothetical protein
MTPNEFGDCTFRELNLFVQSRNRETERQLKEKVLLYESLSDKLLYNDPNIVKRPKKIRLLDRYKDLFKDDYDEMISKGMMRPTTKEGQIKFMEELQEELRGAKNDS